MNKRIYITIASILLAPSFILYIRFYRINYGDEVYVKGLEDIQRQEINGYVIHNPLSQGTQLNFSITFPKNYMNDEIVVMYSYTPMNQTMNLFESTVKHTFDYVILTNSIFETSFSIPEDGFYTFYIMDYSLNKEITYYTAFTYYEDGMSNE